MADIVWPRIAPSQVTPACHAARPGGGCHGRHTGAVGYAARRRGGWIASGVGTQLSSATARSPATCAAHKVRLPPNHTASGAGAAVGTAFVGVARAFSPLFAQCRVNRKFRQIRETAFDTHLTQVYYLPQNGRPER